MRHFEDYSCKCNELNAIVIIGRQKMKTLITEEIDGASWAIRPWHKQLVEKTERLI